MIMTQITHGASGAGASRLPVPAGLRWGLWGLWLVFVIGALALVLLRGPYVLKGNLHDVFIPLVSGVAHLQGVELHRELHTPFGWVYAQLNAWAYMALEPLGFGAHDLIALAALMWSAGLLSAWAALTLTLRPKQIPLFSVGAMALVVACISFNFRGVSDLGLDAVTWYGSYNNHLWGLLFVQMGLLAFQRWADVNQVTHVRAFAVSHALFTYIALHYKVSFGLAAGALALAGLFLLRSGALRWRYLWVGVATMASLVVITAAAGYDYAGYLADLGMAVQAKAEGGDADHAMVLAAAVLFWIVSYLQTPQQARSFTTGAASALVALAMAIGVMGDFAQPLLNFAIAFCFWHVLQVGFAVKLSLVLALVVVLSNILNNAGIAVKKIKPSQSDRYETFHLVGESAQQSMSWRVRSDRWFEDSMQQEACRHGASSPLERRMIWAFPSAALLDRKKVARRYVSNADYIDGVQLALAELRRLEPHDRRKSIYLEFANPLPSLAGSDMPHPMIGWIHFGTATPLHSADALMRSMIWGMQEVVIPLASVDIKNQPVLNCKFLQWNQEAGWTYRLRASDTHNLYFSRGDKVQDLLPDGELRTQALQNCSEYLKAFTL